MLLNLLRISPRCYRTGILRAVKTCKCAVPMSVSEGRTGVGEGVERGVEEEAEEAQLAEPGERDRW